MAAPRAPGARLSALRAEITRDAGEVRRRWREMHGRMPREWREMRDVGRQVLDLFWILLRRRAGESTPPPAGPSPR